MVAKRLTFLPGAMVTIGAFETPDVQPQGDRTFEHGQITQTPVSAVFDPLTASVAPGANEVRVSALEMQFERVGPDDLVGYTEFWQFK
jgi:hypothetical protein